MDHLREEASDAVKSLKEIKVNPIILTGDNLANSKAIADQLSIEVVADMRPDDKLKIYRKRALFYHGRRRDK